MTGKRIIGFVLLIGAVTAFVNKFINGIAAEIDPGIGFYFISIVFLLLVFGIRRVLRS